MVNATVSVATPDSVFAVACCIFMEQPEERWQLKSRAACGYSKGKNKSTHTRTHSGWDMGTEVNKARSSVDEEKCNERRSTVVSRTKRLLGWSKAERGEDRLSNKGVVGLKECWRLQSWLALQQRHHTHSREKCWVWREDGGGDEMTRENEEKRKWGERRRRVKGQRWGWRELHRWGGMGQEEEGREGESRGGGKAFGWKCILNTFVRA